jgi:hypothetical protein
LEPYATQQPVSAKLVGKLAAVKLIVRTGQLEPVVERRPTNVDGHSVAPAQIHDPAAKVITDRFAGPTIPDRRFGHAVYPDAERCAMASK